MGTSTTITGSAAAAVSEVSAYCAASNVASYCQNLLDGSDNFGTSTSPTLSMVNAFISSGCSVIESNLSAWGYNPPPATTSIVYQWLSDLNALYAAARAEMTRINVTLAPGERTRGQVFYEMFWSAIRQLKGQDLTAAGLEKSSTGGTSSGGYLYVGGTSIAGKSTVEEDSDRVTPRFHRDMFRFPDSLTPDTADTDADDE